MTSKKTEAVIRDYLNNVGVTDKPTVDKEAVKALRAQIRTAEDPIEEARLRAALLDEQQGRIPDRSDEEATFVAEAKAWADEENIPVSVLQDMKVPDDVLRKAGFTLSLSRPSAPRSSGGSRAPRIPLDQVQAATRGLGATWTLNDLAAQIDREPATVRNYVMKLIEQGAVKELGDDPSHDGRGRAPKLYSNK